MTTYTTQAVSPPRSWRTAGLALLLVLGLALVAGAALIAGSQSRTIPAFGLAANGKIAFEQGGDIYTADGVNGTVTVLVAGDGTDVKPVWSRDGARLAFTRRARSEADALFVIGADGAGLIRVAMLEDDDARYAFMPEGHALLVVSGGQTRIVNTDGTGFRPILSGETVKEAVIRPGGAEVFFVAERASGSGIYAAVVDGSRDEVRTVVAPVPGVVLGWMRFSPDGARIAYSAGEDDPSANTYRIHVVGADGSGDHVLPKPDGAVFQDGPEWSNDGTRLAITRGYADRNQDMVVAVVPADGASTGVESEHGIVGCCDTTLEWSPDDRQVLVNPQTSGGPARQILMDPGSGEIEVTPWTTTSPPTWQRTAR